MSNLLLTATNDISIADMTIAQFLRLLQERQIHVEVRAGRLKINAPAGAVDATLKAELKRRKVDLVEALAGRAALTEARSGLGPLSAEALRGRIPLTPAQQGIWLMDHFNPGSVAYNIPEAFRFNQALELEVMQAAVDRLVERHSILRTSFHEEDGELSQTIAEAAEARVEFTDLSRLVAGEREKRCREVIGDQGRRPFDLKVAPPIRLHLFRLADRQHIICFNIHHIVADRASLYLLREELVALIEAVQSGRKAQLPATELQFADFAAWVSQASLSEEVRRQVAYWKQKLAGLPDCFELPFRQPMPGKRSAVAATRRVIVTAEAQTALNILGTEEGASPFMIYLAVFAVALARWTRESHPFGRTEPADFCIGSPMSHRKDAALGGMIGLFLNMLALRCVIAPGMSFREVLRQVRGTALEAYENSDVSFQTLVREINPQRSRHSPIFQVMFGYEPYLAPMSDDFQVDAVAGTGRYDLSLHMLQSANGGMTAVFEYCTDLFNAEAIERLVAEGDAAMYGIVLNPDMDVFSMAAWTEKASGSKTSSGTVVEGKPKVDAKRDLLSNAVNLLSSVALSRPKIHRKNPVGVED